MSIFKRISLIVVLLVIVILSGCIPRPNPNVLQRSKPNIDRFLSSYSVGSPMSPNIFAEQVKVTRIGGEFDKVRTFSRQEFADFWSKQFQQWRPVDFSAVIASEYEHNIPPADRGWYARFVIYISYERNDNGVQHTGVWTVTTDYSGRIADIKIERNGSVELRGYWRESPQL